MKVIFVSVMTHIQFSPVDDTAPAIYTHCRCPQRSRGIQRYVCD